MELSQDDIAQIERLLEASLYGELTIETARQKITLRREGSAWVQEIQTLSPPDLLLPIKQAGSTEARRAESAITEDGLVNVFPPLPGTFYRAPKPGAAPFVEVGSEVNADSVIGIIETMKLMNPARAGATGMIAEICATNGQLLEEGQVLMRVRPRGGARA